MSRIRQSWVLDSFKESFNKRWGTVSLITSLQNPMVVFGCFHQNQVDKIAAWRAPVVVVWVGSDSMYLRSGKYGVDYSKILHASHVKHVAISKWIIDDLSACGVPHIYLPITHADSKMFEPVALGNYVYYYCPENRPELYGRKILDAVKERLPDIRFLIAHSHKDIPHERMPDVYSRCFIGLRLTSHDGQPTTVAEMGMMGQKVIHNGLAPNCIPWQGVDDIVESIKREQEAKHTVLRVSQIELALQVRKFLDIGEDWLDTEFYGGVKNENNSLCKI